MIRPSIPLGSASPGLLVLGVFSTIAFLGAPAVAQSDAAESEDFARCLAGAGYFDIAEEVVTEAMKDASGTTKLDLQIALAEIRTEQGRREKDIGNRVIKLKEAADAFEVFLKENPTSPKAADLRFQVADLLRQAGEQAVAAVAAETNAEKREKIRGDGMNIFARAIQLTTQRAAELKAKQDRTDPELYEWNALRFAVGKLHYAHALIHENKEGSGYQLAIQSARTELEDFIIDDPSSLLSFEARRVLSNIAMEEKRGDDALEIIEESVATLAEALAADPSIGEDEGVADAISTAFMERAKLLKAVKKDTEGAIKALEDLQTRLPSVLKCRDGRSAIAMLAEAYKDEAKEDKARALADKVVAADPMSGTALKMRELLDKISQGGGGGGGGGGLLKTLELAVAQRDVQRAERMSARILAAKGAVGSEEDPVEALFLLGQLYYDTGRPLDAAACFQAVASDWAAHKRASESKLNEALSYAQAARIDGSRYWKDLNGAARKELLAKWPNSDEAKDAAYIEGLSQEADGKLVEAVDLFLKVPASSAKYGDAQQKAGKNLLILAQESQARNNTDEAKARYAKAEAALKEGRKTLIASWKNTLNEAEIKRLKDLAFTAGLQLSGLYLQTLVKKPQSCIDLLAEIEPEAKDDKDKTRKLWDLRVKAFVQLGKGKEAGDLLEKVITEAKASGGGATAGAEAALSVASAIDKEALELAKNVKKGEKPDAETMSLWKEATKWYRRAIEEATRGGAGSKFAFESVGSRLLDLGARAMGFTDGITLLAIEPGFKPSEKETIDRAWDALQIASKAASTGSGAATLDVDRQVKIAQCAALLGKWVEAVNALRSITDAYPLFNKDHQIDADVVKKAPKEISLAAVFQDLCVASIRAGQTSKEAFYFDTALGTLTDLVNNSERNGKTYWECRYLNLVALHGAGRYEHLTASLESLKRAAPEADGNRFGIKTKIEALEKQVKDKIISK